MKYKHVMECHGSATVGERGQIVLPSIIRKNFGIKPGDRLLVLGAETGGFKRIILMKADAVTDLLSHMFNMDRFMKEGGIKELEKTLCSASAKTKKGGKK